MHTTRPPLGSRSTPPAVTLRMVMGTQDTIDTASIISSNGVGTIGTVTTSGASISTTPLLAGTVVGSGSGGTLGGIKFTLGNVATAGQQTSTVTITNSANASDSANYKSINVTANVLQQRTASTFTVTPPPVFDYYPGTALNQTVTISNTNPDTSYTRVTVAGSGSSGTLNLTGSATTYNGTTTSANWTIGGTWSPGNVFGQVLTNNTLTLGLSSAEAASANDLTAYTALNVPFTANVHGTAARGTGTTYGTSLTATLSAASASNLVTLLGTSDTPGANGSYGNGKTFANLVQYSNTVSSGSLVERWRAYNPSTDILPKGYGFLASDVVNIANNTAGTTTQLLQMSFDPSLFSNSASASALAGFVWVGKTTTGGGSWTNAVTGLTPGANAGNLSGLTKITDSLGDPNGYVGSWSTVLNDINSLGLASVVGAWGVDPTTDIAWAVTQQSAGTASDFAVVPEPGTLALLVSGMGLGLVLVRRRRLTPA